MTLCIKSTICFCKILYPIQNMIISFHRHLTISGTIRMNLYKEVFVFPLTMRTSEIVSADLGSSLILISPGILVLWPPSTSSPLKLHIPLSPSSSSFLKSNPTKEKVPKKKKKRLKHLVLGGWLSTQFFLIFFYIYILCKCKKKKIE